MILSCRVVLARYIQLASASNTVPEGGSQAAAEQAAAVLRGRPAGLNVALTVLPESAHRVPGLVGADAGGR